LTGDTGFGRQPLEVLAHIQIIVRL
jgi:hypothetical protein